MNLSRDERLRLIERESEELSVRIQAELLSVNRSGVYYQPQPPSAAEVQLKHRIDEISTTWPFSGSRKRIAQLQLEGVEVNRKAIQRHMREMGIEGIHPGPNLSKRTQKEGIFPYLLRHTTSQYPNHIWGLDITYIRLRGSWMYLVAVLDWYSRSVVSWEWIRAWNCLLSCPRSNVLWLRRLQRFVIVIKKAILRVHSIETCFRQQKCKSAWMEKEEH